MLQSDSKEVAHAGLKGENNPEPKVLKYLTPQCIEILISSEEKFHPCLIGMINLFLGL